MLFSSFFIRGPLVWRGCFAHPDVSHMHMLEGRVAVGWRREDGWGPPAARRHDQFESDYHRVHIVTLPKGQGLTHSSPHPNQSFVPQPA